MLVRPVGAGGLQCDIELAVGDGCREVDRERQWFTDAVGPQLDCMQQRRGSDAAEGADHVRPLSVRLFTHARVIDGL